MDIQQTPMIITGSASGMGRKTATLLAKHGAKVSLFDTQLEIAQRIAEEIAGDAFYCDVTQAESVEQALNASIQKNGVPRVCINCAGLMHSRRMVNREGAMPLQEFKNVIEVNLIGTFNVMRLAAEKMMALPLLNQEERGVIINTASIAAYEGQIGQTAYSASKGGVIGLMLPAARELAKFNIRVMTIAPGLVDTPMFNALTEETKQALISMVPFPKRLAKPREYAILVKHIIENSMLNGETIRLDGACRLA